MPNLRVMPTATSPNPFTIPGTTRKYTGTVGSFVDVPDFDASILVGAGWVTSTPRTSQVGATAARPLNPSRNQQFLDTTVGAILIADGAGNWLHSVTGVAS
jgi:hypothetical protein